MSTSADGPHAGFALQQTLPGLLHQPFLARAANEPSRPAVITESGVMTYGELATRSAALAGWLLARGACPGVVVAVMMEKGWEQIVAVLAILRSGAAYLPIDPTLPEQRWKYLISQCRIRLAVTQSWVDSELKWPTEVTRWCVDLSAPEQDDIQYAYARPDRTDIAYIIYTSGSTGVPKGVAIDHRAAAATISEINGRFSIAETDRILALSSLSFDLSVYDIFGALTAGAAIVIPPATTVPEPRRWLTMAAEAGVTVWNSVPALMDMALTHLDHAGGRKPDTLRLALLSGDWIPLSLPNRIKCRFPEAIVVSLGGATEASIWSIAYIVDRIDPEWISIPYGRPLSNQSVHVLDAHMRPCSQGDRGELYIGGSGVAIGYWSEPARTAERFAPHPHTGERIYRTGDYGRLMVSGDIELLGRCDNQVKLRGYRVELGEIEATLAAHPAVRHAVAVAAGDKREDRRLVAYVDLVRGREVGSEELLRHVARNLPSYMVPSAIHVLPAMPLTRNGKIDRGGLAVFEDTTACELEALMDDLDRVSDDQMIGSGS
jgi:pyochelin synthetase